MKAGVQVIVGLGNTGSAYVHTRHNIGFDALDALAAAEGLRFRQSWTMPALLAKWRRSAGHVLLVKPTTFMNRSGYAVIRAMRRQGCGSEDVLVVVDDVELETGRIRIRPKGSAGGHNGVQSVVDALGSEAFPRIRVGVGPRPEGKDLTNYVNYNNIGFFWWTLEEDLNDSGSYGIMNATMDKINVQEDWRWNYLKQLFE